MNWTLRCFLTLLILLVFQQSGRAQLYDFKVLDAESGIVGTKIRDIHQDESGYLWVATGTGLSRFDGRKFSNYTERNGLAENLCSSVFCDAEGRVWVGHQTAGISVIHKDSIQHFSEKNGLINNEIHDIFQDKQQRIWVATFGGLSVFENGKWNSLTTKDGLSSNNIQVVGQDDQGRIWVGSYGSGITILDRNTPQYLHMGNGLVNNYVTSLKQAGAQMLIGTLGGVSSWENGAFKEIKNASSLASSQINDLSITSDGSIWLATFNGANRLSATGSIGLAESNGLPDNEVSCLFADEQDNIWFGTNAGLLRPRNLAFGHHFSTEDLDIDPSTFYADSKARLWAGNEAGGVLIFEDGEFVPAFEDPDINDHQISAIGEDGAGNLWFGTMDFGGLFQWNGENIFIYSDEFGLADNNINCLLTNAEGYLFIGTPSGLSIWDGSGFELVYLSDDIPSNHITTMTLDKDGSVIIAAIDGSVYRWKDGEATSLESLSITTSIWDLAVTDRGLAFATEDGVWIDRPGNSLHISDQNGLHGSSVRALAFVNGKLLAATGNGIEEIALEADTFRIRRYARDNGFLGGNTKKGSMLLLGEQLFIGSDKGIIEVHLNELRPNLSAPKTQLSQLQLSYESVNWSELGFETDAHGLPVDLSLSYRQNNLRFFFTGIDHSNPDLVTYRWKLEGYESDWTPLSDQNLANYPSLPPGDYVFKLVACNSDGVCSESPIEYAFSIEPPFWQTFWFYALLIVAMVIGAYFYVKQREQRLLEEKRILESTVEERTKELREQKEIVERQNQHITESIEYASNIQRAILPSDEELKVAFADHFVFYRPKETVGGDFYWAHHAEGISWAAAVDCTGHGVSGAFMSMIGSDLLNQIIIEKQIDDPAKVLEEMDKGIKLAFAQSAEEFESDQGMDVTLIRVDRKKKQLKFAGAQRPLFIFVDGELQEIEGDRFSISCADETSKTFQTHIIKYTQDSSAYLFSDGITDQFGGERGKKFMVRRVRDFLVDNQAQTMEQQHLALVQTFDSWKGNEHNQLDDVMLMGIRL